MAWDPTHPATSGGVVSAPLRDNFGALDTLLVAPFTALANGQLLCKAAGVLGGVPAGTDGYILTLVGGVPLWQPVYPLRAPDGSATAPSYGFANDAHTGLSLIDYSGVGDMGLAFSDGLGGILQFGSWDADNSEVDLVGRTAGALIYMSVGGGVGLAGTSPDHNFQLWAGYDYGWEILAATGVLQPITAAGGTPDVGSLASPIRDLWLSRLIDHTALAVAPPTPPAGHVISYAKTDKKLYAKDDAGVETPLGGGGGVSAVRLPLEQATLPDGTTGNVPPEFVREKSTGTLSGAPSPARTYARFAGDSAAVMESLMWSFLLPSNYGSGGTIRLKWKAAVATTGAVIWKAGAAPVTDGSTDDDAVAFTAVTTASASTAPATQGQSVEVTLALTTTGFAALRWVTVFLARDPVAAADTMTGTGTAGDAILMGVQFEYTAA